MQDVKNPQTKGSSFSAQVWIKEIAICEEADGVSCNKSQNKEFKTKWS